MQVLRVYISSNCRACVRTLQIIADLRVVCPGYPVELINLDNSQTIQPAFVFATPTYVLGDRIISLGNPDLESLLRLL